MGKKVPGTVEAMKLLRENYSSQLQNPKQKLKPHYTMSSLYNGLKDQVESSTQSVTSKNLSQRTLTSWRRHKPNREQVKNDQGKDL